MLKYKNRNNTVDNFYNQEYPQLYGIDVVQPLEECPIPIKEDNYKIVAYALNKRDLQDIKKVILVDFISTCDHRMLSRVEFDENVKDFNHYGMQFYGKDYSIKHYRSRIETFRDFGCEVCRLVRSSISQLSLTQNLQFKRGKKNLLECLEYNFANWEEYYNIEDYPTNTKEYYKYDKNGKLKQEVLEL